MKLSNKKKPESYVTPKVVALRMSKGGLGDAPPRKLIFSTWFS